MEELVETTLVRSFVACQFQWIVLMLLGQRFLLCSWVAMSYGRLKLDVVVEGDSFSAIQWGSGKLMYPWWLMDWVEEIQHISIFNPVELQF